MCITTGILEAVMEILAYASVYCDIQDGAKVWSTNRACLYSILHGVFYG